MFLQIFEVIYVAVVILNELHIMNRPLASVREKKQW